jgi:hypothetical protein
MSVSERRRTHSSALEHHEAAEVAIALGEENLAGADLAGAAPRG